MDYSGTSLKNYKSEVNKREKMLSLIYVMSSIFLMIIFLSGVFVYIINRFYNLEIYSQAANTISLIMIVSALVAFITSTIIFSIILLKIYDYESFEKENISKISS